MPTSEHREPQSASHLAARAVMAYRAGFPIDALSIARTVPNSGIVCDWKQSRAADVKDEKLLHRAFAFIYIGTIIDQEVTQPISEDLRKELASDMSKALDARETAVQWGLVREVGETNPFAHVGYKLASRVLRADRAIIDALANELLAVETMDRDQLKSWLDTHAKPIPFDELERSWSF
jgi:hypothetical protein